MFNLTRQERQVALFLITVALAGAGINFLTKKYSRVEKFASFDQNLSKADLNKVNQEALIKIPGIGAKLAKRIIEYREKQAGFNEIEELKNVKGISDSKYEKIKDYLKVK